MPPPASITFEASGSDFSEVDAYGEIGEADDLVLITTDSSCHTDAFATWTVIVLEP